MCNALKISIPKEVLNSPYLKAEKKRKAQSGGGYATILFFVRITY